MPIAVFELYNYDDTGLCPTNLTDHQVRKAVMEGCGICYDTLDRVNRFENPSTEAKRTIEELP